MPTWANEIDALPDPPGAPRSRWPGMPGHACPTSGGRRKRYRLTRHGERGRAEMSSILSRRRTVLSPARLRADPWSELGRLHALPGDVVRARAGRTRIAYVKGPEPIDELLVRRADQLIKVNTITTPRLRRERFASLGRLLSSDDRAEHLPTRKALTPRFSSAASASGLAEVVAELVADLVESLARAGKGDVAELTGPFAVEVIA